MRPRALRIAALAGILAATSVFVPSGSATAADSVHVARNASSSSSMCRFDDHPATADKTVAVVSPSPAAIAGTTWVKGVQTGGGNSPYCRRFLAPLTSNLDPVTVSESVLRVEVRTTSSASFAVHYAGSQLSGTFTGPSFIGEWPVPVTTDPLVVIHAQGTPQGTATNPVQVDYDVRLTQRVDGTAPVVTPAADRLPNGNGWYDAPVAVTWNAFDPQPGTGLAAPAPQTLADLEGDNTYTSSSICDRAGNCSTGSIDLRIDTVDPTVTPVLSADPIGDGWFDAPVTITWAAHDETSGIAAAPAPTVADQEGTHTYTQEVCDLAGNCASESVELSIDTVAPTVEAVVTEASNAEGWYDRAVAIDWVAHDDTSGLVASPGSAIADLEGTNTYSREVCDRAGNCATGSIELSVDTAAPTVEGKPLRDPDHGDWYQESVSIDWTGTDLASGVAQQPEDTLADLEGTNTYESPDVCDLAGHCARTSVELSIDTVAPTGTVATGPVGITLSSPIVPSGLSGTASDSTSGVDSVTVTYTTDEGATVVEEATLDCAAGGSCTWSAPAPDDGGLYASSVEIIDEAGLVFTLTGAQVLVLGPPA